MKDLEGFRHFCWKRNILLTTDGMTWVRTNLLEDLKHMNETTKSKNPHSVLVMYTTLTSRINISEFLSWALDRVFQTEYLETMQSGCLQVLLTHRKEWAKTQWNEPQSVAKVCTMEQTWKIEGIFKKKKAQTAFLMLYSWPICNIMITLHVSQKFQSKNKSKHYMKNLYITYEKSLLSPHFPTQMSQIIESNTQLWSVLSITPSTVLQLQLLSLSSLYFLVVSHPKVFIYLYIYYTIQLKLFF